MDWESVSRHLDAPLNPAAVKPPPRGKFGEYVDGFHVITEANRIFGHGGWSYEITSLDMPLRIETQDRDGNPQVRVAWRCTVRVHVGDSYREGAAVGMGISKPDNEGDAHESAIKEAETDALKRSLRSYGYTFGLALYEKNADNKPAKTHVRAPERPRDPRAIADSLISVVKRAETAAKLSEAIKAQRFNDAWNWLSDEKPPMAAEVQGAIDARRVELEEAA